MEMIATLVAQARLYEQAVEQAEKDLKDLRARHRNVIETLLPDAMLQAGLRKFVTADGDKVEIAPYVDCIIRAEFKPQAFEWLLEHGHGGIVKTEVVAKFAAGDKDARSLAAKLDADGYTIDVSETVHAGTLKKWAREALEAGTTLPDFFSVYSGTRALIK